jgi:flagellar basal-body rod protein FlgC
LKLAYEARALSDGWTFSDEPLMSSISTIALSGMNAATRRVEVSASNIANVASTGALPAADGSVPTGAPLAYDPLEVIQTASAGGGTQTTVTRTTPSTTALYDPQASFANGSGLVAAPNVDLAGELIGQMIASYSFAANAKVLPADDRMTKALLNITA